MMIDCAVVTDKGPVRGNNEDNYYVGGHISNGSDIQQRYRMSGVCIPQISHTFAVFDGMGGEEYGEVASGTAARVLAEYCAANRGGDFEEYMQSANSAILEETARLGAKRIGTTAAILNICGDRAGICNIGDSRIYMMRQGGIVQLSFDHKVYDHTEKAALLTQHIGISPEEFIIEPYIVRGIRLESGMIFVLCTDGITDVLTQNELLRCVYDHSSYPVQEIADGLIRAALGNHTKDNITAAVVKVN